jgi:two-component system, OmpR family, phosphate regulon sensor histidine kinase PhoR
MKSSKNSLTLTLIVSSTLLLLALQGLWLKNSYERAYIDLRREVSGIFRTTIFSMRDAMLVRSLERIDTSRSGDHFHFNSKVDTLVIRRRGAQMKARTETSQVQIFISSNGKSDSLQKIIRPLALQVQEGKVKEGSTFVLRMGGDSLSIDSIRANFKKAIEKAGYDLPYEVKYFTALPPPVDFQSMRTIGFRDHELWEDSVASKVLSNKLSSEWVRFDPLHRYAVVLAGIRPIVIKEISPQIFFSLFLTLLTSAAFIIMYRSIRAQQKLMELKNDFISNITHELKTPITTVGVAIEAIKDFKAINNAALTNEYLGIAQNELNRLSILTDKILKTAIFENKGIEFQPEPIQMDSLIEQVLASMKLVFEKQGAKVTFEKHGDDFTMTGGNVHLTSVVYNLLDNALKYSLVNPEIKVTLKGTSSQLIFSVMDNGIGIPTEYRKKVFEKFFRVPTGDVHNIKGYGLGLSYVESVVRSHHGTIRVESEPGKGSSFIVTLPK